MSIYQSGTGFENMISMTSFEKFRLKMTLGNLGQKKNYCFHQLLNYDHEMIYMCPSGSISEVIYAGLL